MLENWHHRHWHPCLNWLLEFPSRSLKVTPTHNYWFNLKVCMPHTGTFANTKRAHSLTTWLHFNLRYLQDGIRVLDKGGMISPTGVDNYTSCSLLFSIDISHATATEISAGITTSTFVNLHSHCTNECTKACETYSRSQYGFGTRKLLPHPELTALSSSCTRVCPYHNHTGVLLRIRRLNGNTRLFVNRVSIKGKVITRHIDTL